MVLARKLMRISTPSHQAMRLERAQTLGTLIAQLEAVDREILLLRHFEDVNLRENRGVTGDDLRVGSTATRESAVAFEKRVSTTWN